MPSARRSLLHLAAAAACLFAVGCQGLFWPYDNPDDPFRCEGSCEPWERCVEGQCVASELDGGVVDIALKPDRRLHDIARPDLPVFDYLLPDRAPPDKKVPDKAIPDKAIPDKAIPDKQIPDMMVPDKLVPDLPKPVPDLPTPAPDKGTKDLPIPAPDQAVPDLPLPDQAVPDLPLPDQTVPDLRPPDQAIPDLPPPDQTIPDLLPQDYAVPDLPLPDQAIPDLRPPDHGIPDYPVPTSDGSSATSCKALFGHIKGFFLCQETAKTCRFFHFRGKNVSCTQMCGSYTCLAADNTKYNNKCSTTTGATCFTKHVDAACTCTKF